MRTQTCACPENLLREALLPRGSGKTVEHATVAARHMFVCMSSPQSMDDGA